MTLSVAEWKQSEVDGQMDGLFPRKRTQLTVMSPHNITAVGIVG